MVSGVSVQPACLDALATKIHRSFILARRGIASSVRERYLVYIGSTSRMETRFTVRRSASMMKLARLVGPGLLTMGAFGASAALAPAVQARGAERLEISGIKAVRPALVNTVAALK